MASYPFISFIIPVYNRQDLLSETVHSIINQNVENIEIILINDGSTDNSQTIIDHFSQLHENIKSISTENKGVSHARNLGIDAAHGKYLCFIDSDDVLCINALNNALIELLSNNDYDIIAQEYFLATRDFKKGTARRLTSEGAVSNNSSEYRKNVRHHLSSYLYKRSLIKEHSICFPVGIHHEEDKIFVYQATTKAAHMYLYKNKWFLYRNHTDNIMHQDKSLDYIIDDNIAAWTWLKKKWTDIDLVYYHWRVFTHMIAYVDMAVSAGVPLEHILEKYYNCDAYFEAIEYYDTFRKSNRCKQIFKAFNEAPEEFYNAYRSKRIKYKLRSIASSIPLVRHAYLSHKYRITLSEYY